MGCHRYLTRGYPGLKDTFACIAQVGITGVVAQRFGNSAIGGNRASGAACPT